MAKELADVKPEYIFFAAYLAKDDEAEATKVNGTPLVYAQFPLPC